MSNTNTNDKIIELLEEIVKWQRFNGIQIAHKLIPEVLQSNSEKAVYQYSDGISSKEIAQLSGVSDFTVRSYWKKWNGLGLVIPSTKYKGRYERILSLEDFGIQIQPTKKLSANNIFTSDKADERTTIQLSGPDSSSRA